MLAYKRLSRYRKSPALRAMLQENTLKASHLIAPVFVKESGYRTPIASMPGIYQDNLGSLSDEIDTLVKSGIRSVLIFGVPDQKDPIGSFAYHKDGIVQKAIALIKRRYPDLIVITDCCLCAYTSHGHCGILTQKGIDHEKTGSLLQKIALSYAYAGADIIAPSGMIDGMVAKIRIALDDAGFFDLPILSYAAKFASSFYGPFREAAGSKDALQGDRKGHQIGFTQRKEALQEAFADLEEGADFLMVKPALPYLDILRDLREKTLLPLVAYQTSGEYAMIKAASEKGYLSETDAILETLSSIQRAGASLIITYFAKNIAPIIQKAF